ncbi:nitrilase-related carbon-nitrogen hydrolase [Candidatus Foliamicus sp.]
MTKGRGIDRRRVLQGAALAGLTVAAGSGAPRRAAAADEGGGGEELVRTDGTYATVPLAKDNIRLCVVQSVVRPIDANNPAPGKRRNLNHMLDLIDMAQSSGPPSDILFFHEFPITGFRFTWTREDVQRAAIEVPGEETEEISKYARKHGCYIVFGSYVRDKDWPGHNLSITTIIGDQGEVLARHWKARNIKGVFRVGKRNIELMTTTIYNVLDRYVEMYGEDEVIPVTRTKFGNICTTAVQREPELIRAFALKGCELMLRTATGGFNHLDVQSSAMHNGIYTALVNNAHSPGTRGIFGDTGGGGSGIWGPGGEPLAEARSGFEQPIAATIPLASYRARHRIPDVHWDLYKPVYDGYVPKFGPNLFSDYLPTDLDDAGAYLGDKSRWK